MNENPTLESVINFSCTPGIGNDLDSIISRYKEINIEKPRLVAAPAEERILDKLIWPLRHAKSGYMLGNFLGTIALCGMVAEMVAILIFEISDFKLNNKSMSAKDQEALFGRKFEDLGQNRRVKVLHVYDIIDKNMKDKFETIRDIRNKYLHLWSKDHNLLPKDAIKCFKAAIEISVFVIGQNIDNGKLLLNPSLVHYLDKTGTYKVNIRE